MREEWGPYGMERPSLLQFRPVQATCNLPSGRFPPHALSVLTFGGMTYTEREPETLTALALAKRMVLRARTVYIPGERRWLLGEPLQDAIVLLRQAALILTSRERLQAAVNREEASWDLVVKRALRGEDSGLTVDQFADGCIRSIDRSTRAFIALDAARDLMLARLELLTLVLGLAIHGYGFRLESDVPKWLSSQEVSVRLHCSRRHAQRLARSGKIRAHIRPDGTWWFEGASLTMHQRHSGRTS